jgi:F420-dependent oxidoreductase-like protein
VRLGLHIPSFSWPDAIGPQLGQIAAIADEVGFDRISVMDHLFQIANYGPPESPMLEAYSTLGYLAAKTSSAKLLALCTAVVYREPGLLAKAVTTLDIISGGRGMLGIGAAWNEEEATALGLPFPPIAERFERLEEALQICLQMWSDSDGPFEGRYYHLGRTLNAPQALTRPHPPILIGGSGEHKTLRLVATYADACNLFPGDLEHKLDVLRAHCEEVGRPYDEIEKTVIYPFDPGPGGVNCPKIIDELGALAELGITVAHGPVANVAAITPIELIGEVVIPEITAF